MFVAGFELLPLVHVALHDRIADHHHDGSGAIIRVDFTTTDVADSPDHHDRTHALAPPIDGLARIGDNLDHDHHLSHHDVAVIPTAAPVTSPLPVDRHSVTLAIARAIEPISFSPGRAVARGPPVARS